MEIELWTNSNGNCYVETFIQNEGDKRALKIYEKLERLQGFNLLQLLQAGRIEKVGTYHRGAIYEVKMKMDRVWYRFLGPWEKETLWLVHAFRKKTNKLPQRELETAKSRSIELYLINTNN